MVIVIAFLIFLFWALVFSPAPWLQHTFFPGSHGGSAFALGMMLLVLFYAALVTIPSWLYYLAQGDEKRAELRKTYWLFGFKEMAEWLLDLLPAALVLIGIGAVMVLITILAGGWQEVKDATPFLRSDKSKVEQVAISPTTTTLDPGFEAENANTGTHQYRLAAVNVGEGCSTQAKVGDTRTDSVTFSEGRVSFVLAVTAAKTGKIDSIRTSPGHFEDFSDSKYGHMDRKVEFTADGYALSSLLDNRPCFYYSWTLVS